MKRLLSKAQKPTLTLSSLQQRVHTASRILGLFHWFKKFYQGRAYAKNEKRKRRCKAF